MRDRIYGGRNYVAPFEKTAKTREGTRRMVGRGALWKPDRRAMNDARSALYHVAPEVTVELLKLFSERHVCDDESIHDLLRTPRMQEHLAPVREQLTSLGIARNGRRCQIPVRVVPPSPYILATYDRERLYEEVWAEPSEKVAKRYGFSGVMLAKVCRELQIPKPPRGYWRKKQTGGAVPKRPKLPALKMLRQ